jgi:hypothetical protein
MRPAFLLLFRFALEKDHVVLDFRDRFDWIDTPRISYGRRTQSIIPAVVLGSRSRRANCAVSTPISW